MPTASTPPNRNAPSALGLSAAEARARLQAEGYNELPASRPRRAAAIALDVIREPMVLLLLAAGGVYFALGDLHEGLVLLSSIVVIIAIGFSQERKSERALEALRDLSSPRALVVRDGREMRIAGREVVRGDLVVLHEGDRIPADGVVREATNLSVDESLLTGESVPVRKLSTDSTTVRRARDDPADVYSGTLVVAGQGLAEVTATGERTEMGHIGRALRTIETGVAGLQHETRRIVRMVAIIGVTLSALVTVAYGVIHADWLNGFLVGITLAIAILPEEFPLVTTIFLALGAWRLSRQQVLTRRVPAIETLGATTVLCVDKTGTLTENRMSVSLLYAGDTYYELGRDSHTDTPEAFHPLLEFAILGSQRDPFDPMEQALHRLADRMDSTHLHADWRLVREYPLSPHLLALSHVWRAPDRDDYVVAAKGAPEAIMDLCHLAPARRAVLAHAIGTMAARGLRVLGVARAHLGSPSLPPQQHDFDFTWLGLVGLADPVRPESAGAIGECRAAGIRVLMITGDYPATARSIAAQVGLGDSEPLTGSELDELDDIALRERLRGASVLARMVPQQKLRVVEALKADGEVVAMTGDGVNDAPALKAAHIGIAMGERGTDVAREAADLVLLDDDFASIVGAVRQGRRIFDNIKKAMRYLIAVHVPIAGISLVPVLLRGPLVMLPIHVVFMELIIDPASSIAFETEPGGPDLMRRPPRNPRAPLFSSRMLAWSALQGGVVLAALLVVYAIALHRGFPEDEIRALTFTTLVIANIALIYANRADTAPLWRFLRVPNPPLYLITGAALAVLTLALVTPTLRHLFRFALPPASALLLAAAAALTAVVGFEIMKSLRR